MKTYTFEATLRSSQKVGWQIDDVIGPNARLDFDRPFLPESLARTAPIGFLGADEKLLLNQIRGTGSAAPAQVGWMIARLLPTAGTATADAADALAVASAPAPARTARRVA